MVKGYQRGAAGRTTRIQIWFLSIISLFSADIKASSSPWSADDHTRDRKKRKETKTSILAVSPREHSTDLHATHIHNNNKSENDKNA